MNNLILNGGKSVYIWQGFKQASFFINSVLMDTISTWYNNFFKKYILSIQVYKFNSALKLRYKEDKQICMSVGIFSVSLTPQ